MYQISIIYQTKKKSRNLILLLLLLLHTTALYRNDCFRYSVTCPAHSSLPEVYGVKNKQHNLSVPFEGYHKQRCEDLRQYTYYAKHCTTNIGCESFSITPSFNFCPFTTFYLVLFHLIYSSI